ncbi:hypothetical protein [Nonomuraea sp. NPDC050643]|uniref:hypothetical protein n=1 Tax=Nonomuraea sp. NPDC050643 TaxID=3155660 RepID=UPI0033FA8A7F
MRKRDTSGRRRVAASAAATAILGAALLGMAATPAQADVYNCSDWVEPRINVAVARCASGFGGFRVEARCNSAHWPYTRTIVGPWRSPGGADSAISGDSWGCQVVDSWLGVR